MKKVIIVVGAVLAVVLMIFSVPLTNNLCANVQLWRMELTDMPPGAVCEDSLCAIGRFVGTGNGTQYFTAMLIRSEQNVYELRDWYEPYGYAVKTQLVQQVGVLERSPVLRFEHELDEDSRYYIVYQLKDGVPPFAWLDLRGC